MKKVLRVEIGCEIIDSIIYPREVASLLNIVVNLLQKGGRLTVLAYRTLAFLKEFCCMDFQFLP